MATLNNPFVVYGYKGAEYFCDRQKETEKMISTLHNERNITLVAPRPWGRGDDPFLYPVLAECIFRVFGQSAAHDAGDVSVGKPSFLPEFPGVVFALHRRAGLSGVCQSPVVIPA